jgi:RluA family pseudouridine synthase
MKADIEILLEDEYLLVINKPAGLLSAPDRYDSEAPVVARQLEDTYGSLWPVHRLDKDTSGVLLFARDADSHRIISTAFEFGQISKCYHALVGTNPGWTETSCDFALTPDGDRLHRTIVDGAGKPSLTHFKVLMRHPFLSLIEARPDTGRTHQIRIHLAALGCSIVCDPLYGKAEPLYLSKIKRRWKGESGDERALLNRCGLHAFSISLTHPGTELPLTIEAPYPKDFRAAVTQLSKIRSA